MRSFGLSGIWQEAEMKKYMKAREILRKKYGRKFMAFPMDEVEVLDYYLWLNRKFSIN